MLGSLYLGESEGFIQISWKEMNDPNVVVLLGEFLCDFEAALH